MRRGEVWTVLAGDQRRLRIAVVSGDVHNERPNTDVLAVPLSRRGGGPPGPFAIPLTDTDPVGGMALVAELGRLDPALGVERVGLLTGKTMSAIATELADLFDL